jgi:hypothetical protein
LADAPEREKKPVRLIRRIGKAYEFVHDQILFQIKTDQNVSYQTHLRLDRLLHIRCLRHLVLNSDSRAKVDRLDAELLFEGEHGTPFWMLRALKNRFGAVNEMGVFCMGERGLEAVSNPSSLFTTQHEHPVAGCALLAAMEAIRRCWWKRRLLWRKSGVRLRC